MTRLKSLIDSFEAGGDSPNFESIEDSLKDLINYASFGVSCTRYKLQGQSQDRDMLNRDIFEKTINELVDDGRRISEGHGRNR